MEFIDVDIGIFRDKVSDVQQAMLDKNEAIRGLYAYIQKVNEKYTEKKTVQ